MKTRILNHFRSLLRQPLEPILHLTRYRMVVIGLFFIIGHSIFWYLWSYAYPKDHESGLLRLLFIIGAVPFLTLTAQDVTDKWYWKAYLPMYFISYAPIFLVWTSMMSVQPVNLVTAMCVAVLLVYQIMDWRLATAATAFAMLAILEVAPSMPVNGSNGLSGFSLVQISIVWAAAFLLGVSTAAQRMLKLNTTLQAIGVMAHELRTPLASAAMLTSAVRGARPHEVAHLADRIDMAIKNIHYQIDSQIVNVQLLDLRPGTDTLSACALIQNAIDNYPFRSERERMTVAVVNTQDFLFVGSARLFTQVIQNLLKNALFAIQKAGRQMATGDITFTIFARGTRGVIAVQDLGPGIPEEARRSIFDAFYSSKNNYSSGLGLAFCYQAVTADGGKIYLKDQSRGEPGATFLIEMPLASESIKKS